MQFILTTQHIGFHDEFSVHTVINFMTNFQFTLL